MNQWALPTIAVLLVGYGALSGRLRSTVVTQAMVLFTDAVRVNLGALRREAALPARLLGVGLPLTVVAGTLAGLVLLPQLDLWTAAALATILAPTDAADTSTSHLGLGCIIRA